MHVSAEADMLLMLVREYIPRRHLHHEGESVGTSPGCLDSLVEAVDWVQHTDGCKMAYAFAKSIPNACRRMDDVIDVWSRKRRPRGRCGRPMGANLLSFSSSAFRMMGECMGTHSNDDRRTENGDADRSGSPLTCLCRRSLHFDRILVAVAHEYHALNQRWQPVRSSLGLSTAI